MKNKLLTKHCALTLLMALIAATWSTNAWAGIKIHVRTEGSASGTAPYLYVWNSTGEKLNGEWSACQMSETTTTSDGQTWYVKEFNETNINAIIHNNYGGNDNQTPDLTGICEDRYYTYKGGNEYYNLTNQYVIPNNATYIDGNFVYFVNTSEWVKPCIWVYDNNDANYNTNSSWPGDEMTKVDGSVNLWVWQGTKSGTPTKIKFSNNGANETSALSYDNGGYYNTVEKITTITKLILNSTNFPDANFRSALATALNVNEGDEIYPNNVKVLDVSNKGITDLTGIANFTNLEELYAQDNSITSSSATSSNIDVGSNRKLRILNASNNSSLTHINGIANCSVLEELYLDGIDFWPSRQISTSTVANKLSATNNPSLKKLSIAGSALQSSFTLPSFPALEYLNLSDNSSFNGFSAAFNIPRLKTFKMSNSNLKSTDVMINCIKNSTGLEYLDLNTNALDSINLFKNTALTHLDLSHNNLFYLNLANQKELVTLNMSYNSKLYCTVNNNSRTNFPSSVTNNGYIYMKNLPKLEEADMSHCSIYRAGAGTQFEGLTSLKKLNLSYNYATHNGSYLASITTSDNNSCMQSLTALEELDLTGCSQLHMVQIDGLPLRIIKLEGTGLNTELLLTNNQLTNLNFPNETSLSTLTSLPSIDVSGNPFTVLNIPQTPNSLLTVTASDCNTMTKILAEHNKSKLQYVTAHNCPALTDITINGADIYFNKQLNAFDATNKSTLLTLDLSNDAMLTNYALDGFTALQTVDFDNNYMEGNNNTIHEFTATNCPALTSVNLGGITGMKTVDLSGNSFSNNSFATVIIDDNAIDVTLKLNNNKFTSIPSVPNKVAYLYLQDNEFAEDLSLDGDNLQTLKGVALSNKSSVSPIKTFTASVASITPDEWDIDYTVTPPVTILANADENDGSNTTLECINLNGNTALETVTVNGFKGLTKLASDNDMTTDKGKGLYVKGNTSIKNLDISNNRFEILGQDNSLNGLSNLETLNASHNKIMTLTNRSAISGARNPRAAYGNGTYTSATCPNIEDLTGLKDLNLSYNLLSDSIHLWKNIALERLDVSHNRTITERNAGEILYYRDTKDGSFKQWKETSWKTVKDMYTNDLNDTIGLRMLDLWHNTNLKYLDISYTNIENTALNWSYVNNRVGPENLQRGATDPTTEVTIGQSGIPRFVLVNHCPELIEFRTNYNAMKSLGVGHAVESRPYPITGCPKLEHLEAIECRGQDPYIMQGEITLSVYNPLLKYYNVSNSNFDKVNPYTNNEHGMSGQNLETLIVDGNYTRDNATAWNLTNAGTLDVSNNPKLVNLQANKCPNLETVKANHLDYLDIISLTQDTIVTTINNENVTTKLANLYVDHDAILNEVLGLETLSALSVYHANDSHFTGDFVMPAQAKATLTDLRVGNEALSLASTRNNLTTVNLVGYSAVKHLETQNNPQIEALDISGFTTTLEHINFANNHIDNSGIGITAAGLLPSLPALKYFNCSNDSKWTADAGNRLTDLILTNSTGIEDIYGNNNDLHYITGSFANLKNIEFAHNHINGIDLSAATGSPTINSEDNGRAITAECAKFYQHGQFPLNEVTVFYFQLEDINSNGQTIDNSQPLASKTSEDSNGDTRHLGQDGFVLDELKAWDASNSAVFVPSAPSGISPRDVTLDPDNMSQYLTDVPGRIVVLKEDPENPAEGRATYTYNNGKGDSEFYLDWTANTSIPTAVTNLNVDEGISIANSHGQLEVNGPDGAVVGVYDLNGRLVASEAIAGGTVIIKGLAPGVYLVNGQKVLVK